MCALPMLSASVPTMSSTALMQDKNLGLITLVERMQLCLLTQWDAAPSTITWCAEVRSYAMCISAALLMDDNHSALSLPSFTATATCSIAWCGKVGSCTAGVRSQLVRLVKSRAPSLPAFTGIATCSIAFAKPATSSAVSPCAQAAHDS